MCKQRFSIEAVNIIEAVTSSPTQGYPIDAWNSLVLKDEQESVGWILQFGKKTEHIT